MNPCCCRCTDRTWIIFDRHSWCRTHFLEEVNAREGARIESQKRDDQLTHPAQR